MINKRLGRIDQEISGKLPKRNDLQGGTLTNVHADLWGLGFQTGTTIDPSWWYNSNTADAGAGLGVADRTRVGDNLFNGAIAGGSTRSTSSAALETFLESLYDAGATPGQYAVFRLNQEPDQSGATGTRRWFINSGETSNATSIRPTLTMDIVVTPEPSGLAILSLAGVATLRRRRS